MRLPALLAVYLVATSAVIGTQRAVFAIQKARLRMMRVNSEAAVEATPKRHLGPENPNDERSALCIADDVTELYRNGAIATVNRAGSNRRFLPDVSIQFCAVGNDGTFYLLGRSVGKDPWANDNQYWLRAYSRTGDLKWTVPTDEHSSRLALARDGTSYLISMPSNSGRYLTAYNADGTLRWRTKIGGFEWEPGPPAIGSDGTIYLYSGVQSDPGIVAFTPQGERRWAAGTSAAVSKIVVASDGRILAIVPSGNLIAFDSNGHRLWSFYSGGGTQDDGLAVAEDGTAYFASRFVFALDGLGKTKWVFKSELTYTQGDYLLDDPVIADDGTVYVSSFDHQLYAVTPDGRKKWIFKGAVLALPDKIMLTSNGILRTQHGWFAVSSGLATRGWPAANHDSRNSRSQEAQ